MSKYYTTETVAKRVISRTTCDHCGHAAKGEPGGWLSISSGHSDWGNDSIDSAEDWDVCSADCLLHILAKIHKDYGERQFPSLYVRLDTLSYGMLTALLKSTAPTNPKPNDSGEGE